MNSPPESARACPCLEGDAYYQNFDERSLGVDRDFGEVSVQRCKRCGRLWLHYLIEFEYLPRSGRWFRGVIAPEIAASMSSEKAVEVLGQLDWYYRGGSTFGGKVFKTRGPLRPWLIPFSGQG